MRLFTNESTTPTSLYFCKVAVLVVPLVSLIGKVAQTGSEGLMERVPAVDTDRRVFLCPYERGVIILVLCGEHPELLLTLPAQVAQLPEMALFFQSVAISPLSRIDSAETNCELFVHYKMLRTRRT